MHTGTKARYEIHVNAYVLTSMIKISIESSDSLIYEEKKRKFNSVLIELQSAYGIP